MGGAKELWSKMTDKLSSVTGGAKERLFSILGFAVKDLKDTRKDAKAIYNYATESGREAVDIGKMSLVATKEAIKNTKDRAIEIGYTGAALVFMGTEAGYRMAVDLKNKGIELGTDAAKKTADAAISLRDMGVDATEVVKRFGADKLEKANNAAKRLKESGTNLAVDGIVFALESLVKAEEMGIDAKKWLEGKGREYLNKGVEIYGRAEKGTKELYRKGIEAKNKFWDRATAAKDRFVNWVNKEKLRMAREAQMEGKIEFLTEQVSRLTALVEARNRLDSVEPETNLISMFDEEEFSGAAAQEALA